MLRVAAEAYFDTRPKHNVQFDGRLRGLLNEYLNYSNRRNEIAHGAVKNVFMTTRTGKRSQRTGAIGFYLVPSFFNPKKFKQEKFSYLYVSTDLIHYRQEFTKLYLRVEGLREDMRRAKSPRRSKSTPR
jgi:hypothetical protein